MEITKSEANGEVRLELKGCLDTAATGEFAAALTAAGESAKVVLGCAQLEFIASSALRQLVSMKKRMATAGGSIALESLNEVVADVFDVTGLKDIFEIR